MKIYLAGPMRGIPEFNFPAFYAAEDKLKEQGHEVFNPAKRDNDRHGTDISVGNATGDETVAAVQHGFSLREALRDDMEWISMEADAIALLPGWQNSLGATAERALAIALHLEVIYLPGATPPQTESDPNGLDAKMPGAKMDAGKQPVFRGVLQYFPRALDAVAGVSLYGAYKYAWKGWESVDNGVARYEDAMGRHILKEAIEGPYDLAALNDPKFPSNILHKTQRTWNSLASLELYLREQK